MEERFFDEIKRYLGFDEADARVLAELRPILEAHAPDVVDRFYERLLEHPRASRAISEGPPQVERLKATLRRWLVELGDGVYDQAYFQRRAAIGKRHVVIDLPQVFMVTGMNVIRRQLVAILRTELASDPARRDAALEAIHKILDVDLAIMLETYRDDFVEKIVQGERRAAIGELGARVNHELRHRLGLVKSSAFLLEKQLGDQAPEPVKRHLAKIQSGAQGAASIVASLLNLARELEPEVAVLDLNHLVREAVAVVPASPKVRVALELSPDSPRISGDPELLGSVIANLVQNAVEAHAGREGVVRIQTAVEGEATWLKVTDEGVGLAPTVMPSLFQPFFTTKPSGTGLGLALARDIVTAHGGTISARNNPDGKGAEFAVSLKAREERRP